jgi:hypothetical protein
VKFFPGRVGLPPSGARATFRSDRDGLNEGEGLTGGVVPVLSGTTVDDVDIPSVVCGHNEVAEADGAGGVGYGKLVTGGMCVGTSKFPLLSSTSSI